MSLRSRPLEGGASGEGGTALFACLFLCGRNCSDFLCQPTIGTNDSFFFVVVGLVVVVVAAMPLLPDDRWTDGHWQLKT